VLVARRALIDERVRSPQLARELEPLLEQAGAFEGSAA
jgi:hypothetical protein